MRIATLLCLLTLNFSMLFAQENLIYPASPSTQSLFGKSTDLQQNTALVGARNGAYIFEYNNQAWNESDFLSLSINNALVNSVSIDNDWIALAAEDVNQVFLYQKTAKRKPKCL